MWMMCRGERRDVCFFTTRKQPNLAKPNLTYPNLTQPNSAPLCTFGNTLSIYIWHLPICLPILIGATGNWASQ